MRFLRFLTIGLVLCLIWVGTSDAGCHVRQVAYQQQVAAVAVTPYVAQYVPVAFAVPTYSVSYAPGAAAATEGDVQLQATETPCDKQLAELKERLAALEAKSGGVTIASVEGSLMVSRCAKCHDDKVSKTEGKGISLTSNGKELVLTAELNRNCIKQLITGKMPKGQDMSDEDRTTLIANLAAAPVAETKK